MTIDYPPILANPNREKKGEKNNSATEIKHFYIFAYSLYEHNNDCIWFIKFSIA